jgi:hypothetical protein
LVVEALLKPLDVIIDIHRRRRVGAPATLIRPRDRG